MKVIIFNQIWEVVNQILILITIKINSSIKILKMHLKKMVKTYSKVT